MPMTFYWLADLLAAGIGALVGAYAAFALERMRRKRELLAAHVEAGYRALMVLGAMRNHALGIYEALIEPWRSKPGGWFAMPMIQSFPDFRHRLELNSLAFLLETGKIPDLQAVQSAVDAEYEFNVWRASVATRNTEKIRSAELLGKQTNPGVQYSDADLDRIFGRSLRLYLQHSAEHLPSQADAVIARLRRALDDLHLALRRNLPDHDFQFPLDPESEEYQESLKAPERFR